MNQKDLKSPYSRRDFLKTSSACGLASAASGVMLPLSVDESRDGELGRFADAESDTAVAGDMAAADEHTDVADVTAAEKGE